jgi:hypothetical protein
MHYSILPPDAPGPNEPIRPPMVYIEKPVKWEYKQIVRNLENEKPLDEAELNALGKDEWEMTGVAQHASIAYFYFKRLVEE